MERLSKEELERIIERDLPGHELVSEVDPADHEAAAEPDAVGPDIAALREKFLGAGAGGSDAAAAPPAAALNEHDQIVAVREKDVDDPYDHRARPKTVIVSGRDKRVVGRQG
jgi:hypothetical protein